jgi:pimeloyl-ACP methyl ester carboxylesterase
LRQWYQHLAAGCRLILLDTRGSGLSGRNIDSYTLDGLILDIEAVSHMFGLERFALLGQWWSGALALAYAARHPEQVSALALWHAVTRASDITPQIVRETGATLIQSA